MHKTRGGVFVDAAHQLDCQGFWLFPGLHVVGCSTDNGLYNGQLYTVLEVAPKVKLQTYGGNDEVTIDMCHIRCIKPTHAITYYSCRGRTLRGTRKVVCSTLQGNHHTLDCWFVSCSVHDAYRLCVNLLDNMSKLSVIRTTSSCCLAYNHGMSGTHTLYISSHKAAGKACN